MTYLPVILGIAAVQGLLLYCILRWRLGRRLSAVERDLQQLSDMMSQMAEIQMKSYRRLSGDLGEVEERIMDLALPSQDSSLPLERRHHVLALARKGVLIDEIVKRLNIPRGEAELILNLRKFADVPAPGAAKAVAEVKRYA